MVSEANYQRYTAILTPGLEWGIGYGWKLPVVEPKRIELPARYREATEKYSGQVRLGPDGRTLIDYVAGLPFPHIDPNDADVAMKIMWNFYYSPRITDDLTTYYYEGDTGTIAKNGPLRSERHYIIDNVRRLMFSGRLYVDPKPQYIPNPDDVRYKESLFPLIEPFDLKGVGYMTYRYRDPGRHDDTWLYLPALRRVRRLSSAQRSDSLFGQDIDPDSFFGYSGHIAWMDYRLIGSKTILAAMHTKNMPVKWQEPETWGFSDVWEPREVWIIEAVSKLPQYAYGKRVIYIDKEGWVVPVSDIYDRAGQLWKVYVNMFSYRRQQKPDAILYEDAMPFHHAIMMLDVQLAHATSIALPSTKTPDRESHFFNQGEKTGINNELFTVANMIKRGH